MVVVWCICKLHVLGDANTEILQNHPVCDYQPGWDKAAHGCVESFLVVLDRFMQQWKFGGQNLTHIQSKKITTQYWIWMDLNGCDVIWHDVILTAGSPVNAPQGCGSTCSHICQFQIWWEMREGLAVSSESAGQGSSNFFFAWTLVKSAHTASAVKACLLGGISYIKCSMTFVNIAVAISALAGGGSLFKISHWVQILVVFSWFFDDFWASELRSVLKWNLAHLGRLPAKEKRAKSHKKTRK